jgi:hypothetical protein
MLAFSNSRVALYLFLAFSIDRSLVVLEDGKLIWTMMTNYKRVPGVQQSEQIANGKPTPATNSFARPALGCFMGTLWMKIRDGGRLKVAKSSNLLVSLVKATISDTTTLLREQ